MDLLDITRRAAALARRKGASDAAAGSYRARHVEVAWRDGRLENVTEATTRGLGLELYVDGRYAAVSTSDLRPEALERFVEDAVALARTLAPDPFRRLPDPELYRGQAKADLQLEDPSHGEVEAAERRRVAAELEAAARAVPGAEKLLSVTTSVSDTQAESALVQTNGFEGTKRGTDFWISAEATVRDPDGRRPEEYAASGGRFRADVEPAERRRVAEAMEVAARAVPGAERFLSVTTSVSDTQAESALVQTNGFEGTKRGTDFWISAEVTVRDPDGRRPEEYAASGARHRAQVEPPAAVGRRAAERALARIGSVKGASAVMTMVVDNRASGRILGSLLGPLSAASVQQKRSYLEGKAGARIGSPRLHVAEDPLVPRGLGSRLYDSEGIAARPFPLFEDGVLRSYYVDTYYGRKLGWTPTTARTSNLAWRLGERSREGLLAEVGEGILVTGFLGGNSNGTTGDFSLGVRGFRIRGGRVAEPVGEMNVSGNHLELWQRLAAVGDDPYPYSSTRTPTLVFDGVQFAGT